MKIFPHYKHHPEIEIDAIVGELAGRGAIQLEQYLHTCLDEGKCYKIFNLKHVKKIDGLGISILEYFVNRGMQIRLFNIKPEIKNALGMLKKENVFKTYNETNCEEVVSLLEKEIIEEKGNINKEVARGRRHYRVNTTLKAYFKYQPRHNEVISGRANILDLSEGGAFADEIRTVNEETGTMVDQPEIGKQTLYHLRFILNGDTKFIETNGEFVRELRNNGKLSAGIYFKDMKEIYKDRIRDFVEQTKTSESILL